MKIISATDRPLIDSILNQLIPASTDGRLPAAGDFGIGDFIEHSANADQETAETLKRGITQMKNLIAEGDENIHAMDNAALHRFVQIIETQHPQFFQTLIRLTYMGYYSRAEIRAAMGLSAKPVQPEGYAVPIEPPDEMSRLTKTVVNRGQCYRSC